MCTRVLSSLTLSCVVAFMGPRVGVAQSLGVLLTPVQASRSISWRMLSLATIIYHTLAFEIGNLASISIAFPYSAARQIRARINGGEAHTVRVPALSMYDAASAE